MNKFLKLLFLGQSINVLADNLLVPIFAIFVLSIGGNAQMAGILWGIQFAVSATVGFFILRLHDKRNLDYLFLKTNFLIKGIAWTLLIFNQSIPMMVLVQVLIGFASAIGGPSLNAITSEHLDKDRHIREWGTLQLVCNIVIAVASVLGGLIMANFGFTPMFILMSLLSFLSFAIMFFTKPPAKVSQ